MDVQHCRWHGYPDTQAIADAACEQILQIAEQAVVQRGQFHIVLAGGETPRNTYTKLARARSRWSAWHVYFGDERCAAPDDPERNSHMARTSLLAKVPIASAHIHEIPAELGATEGARRYADTLRTVGDFDLVLLGLGEDGHTASLFPGNDSGAAPGAPDTLAVNNAPKPPPERVSLSALRLSRSRAVWFLITGAAKKDAISQWRSGADIPARTIGPSTGVDVFLESALLQPV